jgi:hypothetical protein
MSTSVANSELLSSRLPWVQDNNTVRAYVHHLPTIVQYATYSVCDILLSIRHPGRGLTKTQFFFWDQRVTLEQNS